VGRAYAGVLGPLAMATMLAREASSSGNASTMLLHAWLSLVVFALLGSIIGFLAGRIVEDSVRTEMLAEKAALAASESLPRGAAT